MTKKRERKASTALIRDRRTLSTQRIVFLVIAAAAPLAAMIGNVPLAIVYGNGAGLPVAYLVAAIVLVAFSSGYAAMSRRVVNTGAFYTYISRALGKEIGVGAAYLALTSYTAMTCGLAGAFGYFMHELILSAANVSIPWFALSAIGIAIIALLGYRSVDLSAKILGFLMIAEFAVLVVFEIIVLSQKGFSAFPLESFSAHQITSGPFGIAALIAFTSFIGFESAALYGEETKNPERSIPRATYIAVISVGVFYVITTWMIIGATGINKLQSQADADGGVFVLNLLNQYGGEILFDIGAVLLCTSVLAGYSALHNAASRYLFALGRENIAPHIFGQYHKDFFSPHIASLAITGVTSVIATSFAVSGADPYKVFAASLIAVGTLGIVALQAFASLSVVVFFWKRKDRTWWAGLVAPIIGFIGLAAAFFLASTHYNTLTGSDNKLINLVPILLLIVTIFGIANGLHIKKSKPVVYAKLATTQLRSKKASEIALPPVTYTKKYCLVGAGPAGLVMARALIKEGIPFDWYERNPNVGGIWDMSNADTPMYESCHFISSKYTSGFYGYPMPKEFPDYPSQSEIFQYIKGFADEFGLTGRVRFGISVEDAQPIEVDQWRVSFSDGRSEIYEGLINATGVTWHANRPHIKGEELFRGEIMHSVKYRSPSEFEGKRVLIVGAGNSGVDIASDAAIHAEKAYLSVRRGYRFIPKYIFGIPTDALISGKIAPPKGVSITGDVTKLVDSLVGDLTRYGLPKPDHDLLASHPIMNTQVLHHLGHGDLIAKADIEEITETGVRFKDGSSVDLDLIVLATGYSYSVPYLEQSEDEWKDGRPQLYLRILSRKHRNLYFIGYAEFADAAYKRFDEMAQMVVIDIRARTTGIHYDELIELKKSDNPDLAGGHKYIESPRHTNYIEVETYLNYLAILRDRFDWPEVDESTYSSMISQRPST
jgi:cation diffusion facilitator CzcD-associated flavoprotein CzcO/amino acid transporter